MWKSWNDGFCMAHDKNKRCRKKICKDLDFCKSHVNEHLYDSQHLQMIKNINHSLIQQYEKFKEDLIIEKVIMQLNKEYKQAINLLNEKYLTGLLNIYDSWEVIPIIYWIKIDNMWWDIRILVSTLSAGLNQSELENPFPIYPSNPYNRNLISPLDLKKINRHIKNIGLKINIALRIFLNLSMKYLNQCHDASMANRANLIIDIFSRKLRFKLVNYKNSQDLYCGYWVKKKEKKSSFERLYNIIRTTPFYCSEGMSLDGMSDHFCASMLIEELDQEQYILSVE